MLKLCVSWWIRKLMTSLKKEKSRSVTSSSIFCLSACELRLALVSALTAALELKLMSVWAQEQTAAFLSADRKWLI